MKIKQLKIINQDQSTEVADIGADAVNIDYNDTNVKLKLDELSNDNNRSKSNITNLQTELNTTNSNLDLQKTRIDNLAHLDEGSTTADAELVDIRTNAFGRTFSTAGGSIRNFEKSFFENITSSVVETKVTGKFINQSGDEETVASFDYYILKSEKGKLYFISSVGYGYAPNIVFKRGDSLPKVLPGGDYTDSYVIEGTGGNILINNKARFTEFFVGKLNNENDELFGFTDITKNLTLNTGKYITRNGKIESVASYNLYSFSPTKGKVYKIKSNIEEGYACFCYQQGNGYLPNISEHNFVPMNGLFDFIAKNTNTIYINNRVKPYYDVKVYESNYNLDFSVISENLNNSIGMAKKGVFIGDSLTYGQTYTSSSSSYRNYFNYPHFMKKLMDIDEIKEIARSGATATSWWEAFENQITDENSLYFVWLGTNSTLTDTVATDCKGTNYTQYADTETGYLGKILGKISSLTNNKIVLLNLFATQGNLVTNNKVISDFATKFNCILVDIDNTNVTNQKYHTAYNGYYNAVHFNDAGYNYVANIINKTIQNVLKDNPNKLEFKISHT